MKQIIIALTLTTNSLFAFFTPQDMLDRMTFHNAKQMMLMPLHPQQKFQQGIRMMEEMGTLMEYTITSLSKNARREVHKEHSKVIY